MNHSFTLGILMLLGVGEARAAETRIYVSNEDSNDITVIDAAREEVVATLAVGKRPRGIHLSPDGRFLYVALSGSPKAPPGVDESKLPPPDRLADGVGVVDLGAKKVLRILKSGQDPETFDLSADGKTLFVSNEETAEMSVVDTAAGRVVKRIKVGGEPEGVTLRPDGKVVYVTAEVENQVFAVDVGKRKVLAKMDTGPRPRSIVFTRDGKTAFVTCELGAEVTIIDGQKHRPVGSIKLDNPAARPMGAVLSPDGKTVYISNGRGSTVSMIDVATTKVTATIADIGVRPWGVDVSADGGKLYTANGPSGDVSVIDLRKKAVTKRIKVGQAPWGLVVAK